MRPEKSSASARAASSSSMYDGRANGANGLSSTSDAGVSTRGGSSNTTSASDSSTSRPCVLSSTSFDVNESTTTSMSLSPFSWPLYFWKTSSILFGLKYSGRASSNPPLRLVKLPETSISRMSVPRLASASSRPIHSPSGTTRFGSDVTISRTFSARFTSASILDDSDNESAFKSIFPSSGTNRNTGFKWSICSPNADSAFKSWPPTLSSSRWCGT
ncbi:hypothetical protein OGATHE_001707 [Ogataea polymorpha]|uniref:Uncharacterized protein n=1 Tax=Ogataea polymorpha TaxID=460523 RepID=A0A9P8PNW8_9ASCO|nr:hypothetical protein OGATHE_001707 [Ogataea polymorpha]